MARKKNAPAIKSNLRDVPADKFRAVNRMNGIVTMVEYSSEDDIKAYELEPTYQEIGGGGGIDNPVLTVNVVATGVSGEIGALPLMSVDNGVLQIINTAILGGNSYTCETLVKKSVYDDDEIYYDWDANTGFPKMTDTASTLTASNEVNCSVQIDKDNSIFIVELTDPAQPASFTLTVS